MHRGADRPRAGAVTGTERVGRTFGADVRSVSTVGKAVGVCRNIGCCVRVHAEAFGHVGDHAAHAEALEAEHQAAVDSFVVVEARTRRHWPPAFCELFAVAEAVK